MTTLSVFDKQGCLEIEKGGNIEEALGFDNYSNI